MLKKKMSILALAALSLVGFGQAQKAEASTPAEGGTVRDAARPWYAPPPPPRPAQPAVTGVRG